MNDDELRTLLSEFLLYMMDNGVTVKYEINLSELRDEFIAQLNKPIEEEDMSITKSYANDCETLRTWSIWAISGAATTTRDLEFS